MFGARPTRRVARRAGLGAGPADVARRRAATAWTILDDAHFRAAAIPEDDLWGPYTHRGPGPPITVFGTEQGLRYRIPLRTVEDVIEYLRDARDRGRVARRDDGRRRREVRGVADDLGALLGRGRLGRAVLHGARGERRLADDRDAERLARRAPADRPRLRADRLLRGDGRVGAAARRGRGLRGRACTRRRPRHRPELRWLRGASWRNFQVKYREVNDLHKQMLRVVREGRGDGRRAGPRSRPRPPLPGPVERLLLARAVRRHLHQPHAARDARAPDRGRGPRRSRRPGRSTRPRRWTSTSTAPTRCGSRRPGRW